MRNLALTPADMYTATAPLGIADLMELIRLERPDLKNRPLAPTIPAPLPQRESIFTVMRRGDVLLYHPYDSFMPVIDFLCTAAHDPHVVAIKQTLYRVGANSPIVKALLEARHERQTSRRHG
jgi:polyphosphate kinase